MKNNLFLLIIVCSSTTDVDKRNAIRETWAKYKDYIGMSKLFNKIREKYNKYIFTELAKVLNSKVDDSDYVQVHAEDEFDDGVLLDLGVNAESSERQDNYENNITKISLEGLQVPRDLKIIVDLLKKKNVPEIEEHPNTYPDYKVVFLLGMPLQENYTQVQERIEEEVQKYGDIIQEDFVDSYNNLTLKSIMMLKWIINNCNESVRYILKSDDDLYVNVPNLILNLRNRSREYDAKVAKGYREKEYLLLGRVVQHSVPIKNLSSKWYCPSYMYDRRVYPHYLWGAGYVLTLPAVRTLYNVTQRTPYFHIEDIYITGICGLHTSPRLKLRHDPGFWHVMSFPAWGGDFNSCLFYASVAQHGLPAKDMRSVHVELRDPTVVDRCERLHLAQFEYMTDKNDQQYWDVEWTRKNGKKRMLSYRYHRKLRYALYVCKVKYFLFAMRIILLCLLMHIIIMKSHFSEGGVEGWSINTNRNTNIYIQPDKITVIHEPKDVCPKNNENMKNNLFLLIIVCSSTTNFDKRNAIRETWAKYKDYIGMSKLFNKIREKYNKYIFTELAKILNSKVDDSDYVHTEDEFDDVESDNGVLLDLDVNAESSERQENYENNIQEEERLEVPRDLKIIDLLKQKNVPKTDEYPNIYPDFKVVFLLGMPLQENYTQVQERIEEEVQKYGDIIQEDFVDSYNNLTLKSIMMLKWIINNCNESVRYILKCDDDLYVNVPNLVLNLRNRSREYDAKVAKGYREREYLLLGYLIHGAVPIKDLNDKWYCPSYMYNRRVYPHYLSGTGYVLTVPAARALYNVTLRTPYFHLEDIYITGICGLHTSPRLKLRHDPGFWHVMSLPDWGGDLALCVSYASLTQHRLPVKDMRLLHVELRDPMVVDRCERLHLVQKTKKENQYLLYKIYKYLDLVLNGY